MGVCAMSGAEKKRFEFQMIHVSILGLFHVSWLRMLIELLFWIIINGGAISGAENKDWVTE